MEIAVVIPYLRGIVQFCLHRALCKLPRPVQFSLLAAVAAGFSTHYVRQQVRNNRFISRGIATAAPFQAFLIVFRREALAY